MTSDAIGVAFAGNVAQNAARVAIEDHDGRLSYAELDSAARIRAAELDALRPGKPGIVGCKSPIGIDVVVGLLGAHLAGWGFVWLDPAHPPAVHDELADHAQLDARIEGRAAATALRTGQDDDTRDEPGGSDRLSHIRYTSGSTGRPKGVPITVAQVEHALTRLGPSFNSATTDRFGLFGHFWPLVIFEALTVGATLVCIDPLRTPGEVIEEIRGSAITVAATYTALFRQLFASNQQQLPLLRLAHLSGEALHRSDVEAFERACSPPARLVNSYGSSEYPMIATFDHVVGEPIDFDTIPYGRAVDPSELRLLDTTGSPVSPGDVGEIVIHSDALPSRYVRDPERSVAVFGHYEATGQRIYRTGDLARMDAAGLLHPMGRTDDQVKIRGQVVRLGELEREIIAEPGVEMAAVAAIDGDMGSTKLVCWFVPDQQAPVDARRLRQALTARLANHIVPHVIRPIDALPVGSNGKLDRGALTAFERSDSDPPTEGIEAVVAATWQRVLGHSSFDRTSDFFEVGGDSLSAMAMVSELESVLDVRLPLEAVFVSNGKLASVAQLIGAANTNGIGARVVTVRPGTDSTRTAPILLCPMLGGGVAEYLPAIDSLSSRPIVTVHPPGMDGRSSPSRSIGELAEHVVSRLVAEGVVPAAVVGYSFGGLVAVEVVRRLARGGHAPSAVLIEPDVAWARRMARLRIIATPLRRRQWRLAYGRLLVAVSRGRSHTGLTDAHADAVARYRPDPIAVRTLLITGSESDRKDLVTQIWAPLLHDRVEHRELRGDHNSLLQWHYAEEVSDVVRKWLLANESRQ